MWIKGINSDHSVNEVYDGKNVSFAKENGFIVQSAQRAFDGRFYINGHLPRRPVNEQNDVIRQKRREAYVKHTDNILFDALENSENLDVLQKILALWKIEKDKIRKAYPYI